MMKRTLSAYPLFIKDTYFSIWSDNEEINKQNPMYWVGNKKVMRAYVEVDGEKYVFFGKGGDKLVQTEIKTEGYSTVCLFTSELFDLKAEFLSPLFIDDLEALSRPVCYLRYEIMPKKDFGQVKVVFEIEERLSYDTAIDENRKEKVHGAVLAFDKFETAYIGLQRQGALSCCNDSVGADWGYWYVSGDNCYIKEEDGYKFAVGENVLDGDLTAGKKAEGFFMLGFDDIISLNYFGRPLVGYYFRDGKTITDALEEAYLDAYETFERAEKATAALNAEWMKFGENYARICHAAWLQTIGAHKLAYDYKTGKTLFISRENSSAGCAATLDITYPSAPMFLRYNPQLLRGMLYPIFEFAKTKIWENKSFAPHDVGMYPLCYGEFYSMNNSGNKYVDGIAGMTLGDDAQLVILPKLYHVKKDKGYYNLQRAMPIEESANVLILAYAAYLEDGNKEMIEENYEQMKRWADYLVEKGKLPETQLCTDDFCGKKGQNVNLTLKSVMGLYAFSKICETIGKDGSTYMDKARDFAKFVEDFCKDKPQMPATFIDTEESYSLKYNLAFDLYFQSGIFSKETFEKEVACYRKNMQEYGVKLYSEMKFDSTKSDWLVWVACFSDDKSYREEIYASIVRSMRDSKKRMPFSDWYCVTDAEPCPCFFKARSAQGGLFMPLIIKE